MSASDTAGVAAVSRRSVVQGALAVALASTVSPIALLLVEKAHAQSAAEPLTFNFAEIAAGVDANHHVAEGYEAKPLLRWGDPLFADAPAFTPDAQTPNAQKRQFGANCDFIGYVPIDGSNDRGLLCVNHEYIEAYMSFPGVKRSKASVYGIGPDKTAVEMTAIGGSIVEIVRKDGAWSYVRDSKFNRRITALDTPMRIDGPAAGHARMMTAEDATGTKCIGTLGNCAGGITPWGTWLLAEENFQMYFWTDKRNDKGEPEKGLGGGQKDSWAKYGVPSSRDTAGWGLHHARFNLGKEANEVNRFGWIVEVDPLDPDFVPVKRTALGRCRHEGAENALANSGQIVVYTGDDDRNQFVYKFVSKGTYKPDDRKHNRELLSDGTLYVARYDDDFTGQWLKLAPGEGKLAGDTRFPTLAEIMIDTRIAAEVLGATPMDRPEDVEPGPGGRVIVALTNNSERLPGGEDKSNPRAPNPHGHIIEMIEDGGDVGATSFRWSIVVKAGPKTGAGADWHKDTTDNGSFSCPDNVAFDPAGRLWIATDQGRGWATLTGRADGLYALDFMGANRGRSRLFFRAPVGAEVGGPRFTADGTTLFLSVQHPSADNTKDWAPFGRDSTADDPATRWPDTDPASKMPPRASVVVITRKGGGRIAV